MNLEGKEAYLPDNRRERADHRANEGECVSVCEDEDEECSAE